MEEIINMKHVICIDLDGTLLNSNNEIGDMDINYLKSIKDKHHIILSSGRPFESIKKYYNQLELDTPVICSNGAYLFNPRDPMFNESHLFLHYKDIIDIFKKMKKHIISCMSNKNNVAYIYNHMPKTDFLIYFNTETKIVDGPFNKTLKDDLYSVFFIIDVKEKDKFKEIIKEYPYIKCRQLGEDSHNYIVELSNEKTDKSYAIKKLLRYYKCSAELLIAFGDSQNDKESLLLAQDGFGQAVIVENASKELRETFNNVTASSNNCGVSKFLKEFFKDAK